MKNSTAIKLSISTTPLYFTAILGLVWFYITLFIAMLSPNHPSVCWEAGIVGSMSYGFIAIRNFMENSHFENFNKNEK